MRKTKTIIALLIIIGMIFAYVPFKAFANNPETYEVIFTSNAEHIITATGNAGELMVNGQVITLQDTNQNGVGVVNIVNEGTEARITVPVNTTTQLNFNTADKFDVFYNGQNYVMGTTFTYQDSNNGQIFVAIQDHVNQPQPGDGDGEEQNNQNLPNPNTIANITVTGGEGGYNVKRYDPEQNQEFNEFISYKKSYVNARIAINGYGVWLPEGDENAPESTTVNDFNYYYSADDYAGTENEGKVKITIGSLFLMKAVGTFKINNVSYNVSDFINYTNRENWLDHYEGQCVSFDVYVDKADAYNIELNLEEGDETTCFIGNFLWTADPNQEFELDPDGNPIKDENGEPRKNDNYIGHSKLQLAKISYQRNGHTVTVDFTKQADLDATNEGEREVGPGNYYQGYTDGDFEYGYLTKQNNKNVNFDDGSLVVPEGATVTMKIVPDYGYQVTSFGVNGNAIITGDNISEFSFVIEKGNFHLGAEVTKVDDKVKSTIDGIKGGTITMAEGEIDSGSVMLSVADAEPTAEKAEEFNENTPEGYEVAGFMDISLAQVFYKGSEDDVWTIEKEDLNKSAKIELELEEDIDPENSVLVHNVHDGEKFETVEFEYDATTKKMSFDADSFSKYAFAVKTEANPTTNTTSETKTEEVAEEATEESTEATTKASNPFTGDNIVKFVTAFAIASLAFYVFRKNNQKTSKH